MLVLSTTTNKDGAWYRVNVGGTYVIASRVGDAIGGGTIALEFREPNGAALVMPTSASFTANIPAQTVVIPLGVEVRVTLTGATSPTVNVDLYHSEINPPTLYLPE